jgi:hypothetical protein
MKVLLLTDIPPCENFTAGLVLDRLARNLLPEKIALCAVINRALKPEIPSEFDKVPTLLLEKPREASFRVLPRKLGDITAFAYEVIQGARVRYRLLPQIAAFAKSQQVDAIWVVLQGQSMIRLARRLSQRLGIPLFTQVWDPFEWWLRANRIDSLTGRRLLAEFDRVLQHSTACATASWAMSETYTEKYKVRNCPVIAGLPKELARTPATRPNSGPEIVIALAGQFYAQSEWDCLINALNRVNWRIAGRAVRIRVLGGGFQSFTHSPANFEYLGWQSQTDTIRLLADSDLLYMPYWFSEEFRGESSNSFPSKLVSYFAAGRPVFCHAPSYASPAKYIQEHKAGYLCSSLDSSDVLAMLEYAMTDGDSYATAAKNGTICFHRDFTLEDMKASFEQFLGLDTPIKGVKPQ